MTLYFEDFHKGQIIDCGTRAVTKEEVFEFAGEFDPQPHHLDEDAAKSSMLGGLSASGWHVCAMAWRLACDGLLLKSANRGGSRVAETRWIKPVRPGDVLRLEIEIIDLTTSPKSPGLGFVKMEWRLFTGTGQVGLMIVTPR
ncbi:MAG TPA: MaoC/PaaZ C-terminal domain-containing protein, partial [Rhizomicrobium sp.]|nr:MaoC/PaaZ C-terminal domain-containing protein [Rhizomicrobium sp.]